MGIVAVAFLAAKAAGVPVTRITSGPLLHQSDNLSRHSIFPLEAVSVPSQVTPRDIAELPQCLIERPAGFSYLARWRTWEERDDMRYLPRLRCLGGEDTSQRGQHEASAVHAGMVGPAANQVKRTCSTVPRMARWGCRASSSTSVCTVVLVRSPRHAGPAVARPPDDWALDAGLQLAALAVIGRQVGTTIRAGRLIQVGRFTAPVTPCTGRLPDLHAGEWLLTPRIVQRSYDSRRAAGESFRR
jgi:hypothetical protein